MGEEQDRSFLCGEGKHIKVIREGSAGYNLRNFLFEVDNPRNLRAATVRDLQQLRAYLQACKECQADPNRGCDQFAEM